ncbi:MAG: tetratricopeptide repeat protein [Nitrospira sp.]|nr:sel1 repeat family protein [Nitrospira sp.]
MQILVAVLWIMLGATSAGAIPYEDEVASTDANVDFTQAAPFTRSLAKLGHAWAQFDLATMLKNGIGVRLDKKEAMVWYRKAAEQKHVGAMRNLARLYQVGTGEAQDPVHAYFWYSLAAVSDEEAKKVRDQLEHQMSAE